MYRFQPSQIRQGIVLKYVLYLYEPTLKLNQTSKTTPAFIDIAFGKTWLFKTRSSMSVFKSVGRLYDDHIKLTTTCLGIFLKLEIRAHFTIWLTFKEDLRNPLTYLINIQVAFQNQFTTLNVQHFLVWK